MVTYIELVDNISKVPYKFPIKSNSVTNFDKNKIEHYANNSYPLINNNVIKLISNVLQHKREHGSPVEQNLYKNFNTKNLISRLIEKRPLVFMGFGDKWVLQNGNAGFGGFKEIGTDKDDGTGDLTLGNYMSYEEIELAVFVNMSMFTPFINDGSRRNCGNRGVCESEGIYIAQVGARFEERFYMEWKHIIIDPEQNTKENGYGKDNSTQKGKYLQHWANFYGVDYFPLYDECTAPSGIEDDRYISIPGNLCFLFDTLLFKKRIEVNAFVFLTEANNRARLLGKKAFCHIVGLGLGVWNIHPEQERLSIEVYIDLLNRHEDKFTHIHTLYFAWMDEIKYENTTNIEIKYGYREPAEKLNDPDLLLVANYAWDGNSYPGNEYWIGSLFGSGDPAAACCSLISQLQNHDINPNISVSNTRVAK